MTSRVIDFKYVDMTDEEYEYYQRLVAEFTYGNYLGKDQFHDIFDVDEEGCITFIRPPLKKQVAWAVIVFLQNLMANQHSRRMEREINQRLEHMEKRILEFTNGKISNS
jgi:hypothetical protein